MPLGTVVPGGLMFLFQHVSKVRSLNKSTVQTHRTQNTKSDEHSSLCLRYYAVCRALVCLISLIFSLSILGLSTLS